MSQRIVPVLALAGFLAACGGNPFLPDPTPTDPTDPTTPTNPVPPLDGTTNPTPSSAIQRYEPREDGTGNGYAENIRLNPDGTFSVDNLAFDGDNLYTRGTLVSSLGPYEVYEAKAVVNDPLTNTPINQFEHRLIYGESTSGRTSFALVRTGAYTGYGFGGFVMLRDDTGVTLPTTGQAAYSGRYAGLQDFDGRGGLRYTEGNISVDIDFEDFNDGDVNGDAVKGRISDRRILDMNNQDITAQVMAALDLKYDPDDEAADLVNLPIITFAVGPNTIDPNGEIRGTLDSRIVDYRGDGPPTIITYEQGNYYAILSGPNADELVGIIVIESEDPFFSGGVTQRETDGFILLRQ